MNCSKGQAVMGELQKGPGFAFGCFFWEVFFQVLLSKITRTKVLQHTLPKSSVSHNIKTKMKEVIESLQPPVL